jgi:hypothetical protein
MPINCENSKKVAKKYVVTYFLRRGAFGWGRVFFSLSKGRRILTKIA